MTTTRNTLSTTRPTISLPPAGMVRLEPGDMFINGGLEYVVFEVTDSGARCKPTGEKRVQIKDRFAAEPVESVSKKNRTITVSAHCELTSLLARKGKEWVDNFLAKKSRRPGENKTGDEGETEEMKTQLASKPRGGLAINAEATSAGDITKGLPKRGRKPKAEPKTPKAKGKKAAADGEATSKGKLGELFGFSVTSVIRALGKAGCSAKRVKAILAAKKVDQMPSDTTVSIQVGRGANGKQDPAPVSKDQLKELLDLADEPAVEAKAEEKK